MTVRFHHDPRMARGFRLFSLGVAVLMCVVALVALAGWWWDLPRLTAVLVGVPSMTPGVAIGFALSGAALLVRQGAKRWGSLVGSALSLAVLGIGAVTFGEYVLALDLGSSHWFVTSTAHSAGLLLRRTAALAAVALVLLGVLGLLASIRRWLWLRETLAVALLAIAMTGLASHGFAVAATDKGLFDQIPVLTTLLLLLATLGWLAATPSIGLTRVVTATSLGGTLARRVLLPALLLPVAFTYVFQLLQSWLSLSGLLTFSLMATVSGGAVAALIWWVALLLDNLEWQRDESARLRTDADTDVLTSLANRRALDDTLNSLLKGHRERDAMFSLLMLDLDRFKDYNDDFGHLAGDDVLRITGGLLRAAVRPSDLAARYGGEEFVLLLPATDVSKAGEVAQRVLEAFRGFAWPHRAVTISIGVAQSATGDDTESLIGRADAALYEAKATGRNRAVTAAAAASLASRMAR